VRSQAKPKQREKIAEGVGRAPRCRLTSLAGRPRPPLDDQRGCQDQKPGAERQIIRMRYVGI